MHQHACRLVYYPCLDVQYVCAVTGRAQCDTRRLYYHLVQVVRCVFMRGHLGPSWQCPGMNFLYETDCSSLYILRVATQIAYM